MQSTLTSSALPQSQPATNPALQLSEYLIMRDAFLGWEIQIHLDRASQAYTQAMLLMGLYQAFLVGE